MGNCLYWSDEPQPQSAPCNASRNPQAAVSKSDSTSKTHQSTVASSHKQTTTNQFQCVQPLSCSYQSQVSQIVRPQDLWASSSIDGWKVAFSSLSEYRSHFEALLELENRETLKSVQACMQKSPLVEVGDRGRKSLYKLSVSSVDLFSFGDRFLLRNRYGESEEVTIHDINETEGSIAFLGFQGAVSIEFLSSLPHYRMVSSLRNLSASHPLIPLLLGHSASNALPHSSFTRRSNLDTYQNNAIKSALKAKVTLVHGPPGSGKTTVAAALVLELVNSGDRVLVCAPSNVAADNLALKLHKIGVSVVRVYSKTKEEDQNLADEFALHKLLGAQAAVDYPSLKLSRDRATRKLLQQSLTQNQFSSLCLKVLRNKKVVCCTCATASDQLLTRISFNSVLIDEAAFCIEPEALIPISVSGCRRVILVGDPKQLRPIVESKAASSGGLNRSLFERLEAAGVESKMLAIQYRMHPVISFYPRMQFYNGDLKDGITPADRSLTGQSVHSLFSESPLLFVNCQGQERQYRNTASKCNTAEARVVAAYTHQLLSMGVSNAAIGVVTSYDGQRLTILDVFRKELNLPAEAIEVKNIDGYQGREKDFIIISCVRANLNNEIGFLKDINRINVALTRAKYGLIVIGNEQTLRSDSVWRGFLKHVEMQGRVIKGGGRRNRNRKN